MYFVHASIEYTGFTVVPLGYPARGEKHWYPTEGEYTKNLFATYMYRGHIQEFRKSDNTLCAELVGETFLNTSIVLDYETVEIMTGDTTWLCFSSYMPYTATYHLLRGSMYVPAGVGAFCVLGHFTVDGKTARALNYMKPRNQDTVIEGDAKVLFIKRGEFVNPPRLG